MEAFTNARPSVLDLARKARDGAQDNEEGSEKPVSKKRKIVQSPVEGEDVSDATDAGGILTRSQSRRVDQEPQPTTVDLVEDSQDEDYVPGMFLLVLCL